LIVARAIKVFPSGAKTRKSWTLSVWSEAIMIRE
jgi:hypothetical protein